MIVADWIRHPGLLPCSHRREPASYFGIAQSNQKLGRNPFPRSQVVTSYNHSARLAALKQVPSDPNGRVVSVTNRRAGFTLNGRTQWTARSAGIPTSPPIEPDTKVTRPSFANSALSRICALKNYNAQWQGTFIELTGTARYTVGDNSSPQEDNPKGLKGKHPCHKSLSQLSKRSPK
jgi:hypothetical protein